MPTPTLRHNYLTPYPTPPPRVCGSSLSAHVMHLREVQLNREREDERIGSMAVGNYHDIFEDAESSGASRIQTTDLRRIESTCHNQLERFCRNLTLLLLPGSQRPSIELFFQVVTCMSPQP